MKTDTPGKIVVWFFTAIGLALCFAGGMGLYSGTRHGNVFVVILAVVALIAGFWVLVDLTKFARKKQSSTH